MPAFRTTNNAKTNSSTLNNTALVPAAKPGRRSGAATKSQSEPPESSTAPCLTHTVEYIAKKAKELENYYDVRELSFVSDLDIDTRIGIACLYRGIDSDPWFMKVSLHVLPDGERHAVCPLCSWAYPDRILGRYSQRNPRICERHCRCNEHLMAVGKFLRIKWECFRSRMYCPYCRVEIGGERRDALNTHMANCREKPTEDEDESEDEFEGEDEDELEEVVQGEEGAGHAQLHPLSPRAFIPNLPPPQTALPMVMHTAQYSQPPLMQRPGMPSVATQTRLQPACPPQHAAYPTLHYNYDPRGIPHPQGYPTMQATPYMPTPLEHNATDTSHPRAQALFHRNVNGFSFSEAQYMAANAHITAMMNSPHNPGNGVSYGYQQAMAHGYKSPAMQPAPSSGVSWNRLPPNMHTNSASQLVPRRADRVVAHHPHPPTHVPDTESGAIHSSASSSSNHSTST